MTSVVKRCQDFIDAHPRTGWYVAVMVTINLLVNVLNLIH